MLRLRRPHGFRTQLVQGVHYFLFICMRAFDQYGNLPIAHFGNLFLGAVIWEVAVEKYAEECG